MPVVPINPAFTNISEFITSLFDPDVRTSAPIEQAISNGLLFAEYSAEVLKIPPVWLAAWQESQGDPFDPTDDSHCPATDRQTFAFIADYIRTNNLSLFVPQISYAGDPPQGSPAVFQLDGYAQMDLLSGGAWQYDAVQQLLRLFLHGAHFVVVSQPLDLPPGVSVQSFADVFRTGALADGERHDPGNSHYTSALNVCGWYFPSVTSNETPPDPTAFNLAWLVGLTVSQITCDIAAASTFFQLEGWQSPFPRHNADFQTFQETLWNISTFGACPYSEKRGTAVFLAPASWKPQPNGNTIMPPYVGAESVQPWLNQSLVQLAPDNPVLVVTRSGNQPQSGQKNRSSENFRVAKGPAVKGFIWRVVNGDSPDIRFSVMQDVFGSDPVLFSDLQDGSTTAALPAADNYYIASPSGGASASDSFQVWIEAQT